MDIHLSKALIIFLLAISGSLIFEIDAIASDDAESENESCLTVGTYFREPRRRLSSDERESAGKIGKRAEVLATGVLRVEEILDRADYEPSRFRDQGLAWAAVLNGEAFRIGVYRPKENGLERLDMLSHGEGRELSERFALAEQALANTPSDCSLSFGVLDQGLDAANGERALYAIQLVDRSEKLAWGMHYRFGVVDGELRRLDRLHVRCSVMSVVPKMPIDHPDRRGRPPLQVVSLPGMDLPTEAQLMQLHLYPDLPGSPDFKFWTRERVFDFPHGQTRFPERYERRMNPCSLKES